MTEPYSQLAAPILLAVLALWMTGAQLVSIARDADWWVITRGTVGGRIDRLRRGMKPRRG